MSDTEDVIECELYPVFEVQCSINDIHYIIESAYPSKSNIGINKQNELVVGTCFTFNSKNYVGFIMVRSILNHLGHQVIEQVSKGLNVIEITTTFPWSFYNSMTKPITAWNYINTCSSPAEIKPVPNPPPSTPVFTSNIGTGSLRNMRSSSFSIGDSSLSNSSSCSNIIDFIEE